MADYVVLLGRAHGQLGGAARTIEGYVVGLLTNGHRVTIGAAGSVQEIRNALALSEQVRIVPLNEGAIRSARSLHRVFRSASRPTVIFVGVWHRPFFLASFVLASRWITRRPKIAAGLIPTMSLTDYDIAKRRGLKLCLGPLVRLLLQSQSGVVFSSSGEQRTSRFVPRRRSTVVFEPTLVSTKAPRPSSIRREDRVLFVGRLDPQKDVELLFSALVLTSLPIRCHIIGDGTSPYRRDLETLAKHFAIEDRLSWMGWVDPQVVYQEMTNAKVVVVTSVDENFCHVAIEAAALGCEVVMVDRILSASDLSAFPSIAVCDANALSVAAAIDDSISQWEDRADLRTRSSEAVLAACEPTKVAADVHRFLH